jgi:biotin carboxyl carrier protein
MEITLNNRTAHVELVARSGNLATISVDGKIYEIDIARVEEDAYSVLLGGLSFNVEVVPGETPRQFQVNTYRFSYTAEVIDAEEKYRRSRGRGKTLTGDKSVVAPMPGKVVKILVAPGQEVEAGQTAIIISAMKMESEFRVKTPGRVSRINVKEGDTVEGRQVLIVIE